MCVKSVDSLFGPCYNVIKPKRKKSTHSLSLHRESRMVGSRQGYLAEWASEGVAERVTEYASRSVISVINVKRIIVRYEWAR